MEELHIFVRIQQVFKTLLLQIKKKRLLKSSGEGYQWMDMQVLPPSPCH